MTAYRSVYTTPLPIDAAIKTFISALIAWVEDEYTDYLGAARLDGFEPGMRYQPDERLELIWADETQQSGDRLVGFAVVDALGETETITRVMIAGGPSDPKSSVVSIEIGPDLPTAADGTAVLPTFVADLLNLAQCDDHGIILTAEPLILTPEDVPELLTQVSEDDHHVHVVLAGTATDLPIVQWRDFVGRMLAPVRGMSAVYVLNAAATAAFNHQVEAGHRAEPGALRVLAPGARLTDAEDTGLNQLIPADGLLDDSRRDRIAGDLCQEAIDFALSRPLARREQRYLEVLDRYLDELLTSSPVIGHGATSGRAETSSRHPDEPLQKTAPAVEEAAWTDVQEPVDDPVSLHIEAEDALKRAAAAEAKAQQLEELVTALRAQVRELEASSADLADHNESLEHETAELRAALAEAQAVDVQPDLPTPAARSRELAQFHAALAELRTDNDQLRRQVMRLTRGNARLRGEIGQLRAAEKPAQSQTSTGPSRAREAGDKRPETSDAPVRSTKGSSTVDPQGRATAPHLPGPRQTSAPDELSRLGVLVTQSPVGKPKRVVRRRAASSPRRNQPVAITQGMETVARARLVTATWDLEKDTGYDSIKVKQAIADAREREARERAAHTSQVAATPKRNHEPKDEVRARRIAMKRKLEDERARIERDAIRGGLTAAQSTMRLEGTIHQQNPVRKRDGSRAAAKAQARAAAEVKAAKKAEKLVNQARLQMDQAEHRLNAVREALSIVSRSPAPAGEPLVLTEQARPYSIAEISGNEAPGYVFGALREEPEALAAFIVLAEKIVAVEAPISPTELIRAALIALGAPPDQQARNLWRRLLTVVPVQQDQYSFVWGVGRVTRPSLVQIKSARTAAPRGQVRMADVHPHELALLVSRVLTTDGTLSGRRLEAALRRAITGDDYGSYPSDEESLRYARSLADPTRIPLQLTVQQGQIFPQAQS